MTLSTKSYQTLSAMGIGDIISRSWRLYRLNFKQIIVYGLIGTPLLVFSQLLLNMPSVVSQTPEMLSMACCCFYPVGLIIFIMGMFIAIWFNFCMVKSFFNKLTGENTDYKYIFDHAKKRVAYLIKFSLLLVAEIIVFYLIDTILLFVLLFLMIFTPILLGGMAGRENEVIGLVAGITMCIFSIGVIIFLTFFIILQFLICALQIVIVTIEDITVVGSFLKSIDIVANNVTRSGVFAISLTMLWYLLVLYFNMPPLIYSFYEMFKDGMMTASAGTYPLHVLIVATLWGFLVNMLTWPWVVSGLTLFYYDIKVRNEGFDLLKALQIEKRELAPKSL